MTDDWTDWPPTAASRATTGNVSTSGHSLAGPNARGEGSAMDTDNTARTRRIYRTARIADNEWNSPKDIIEAARRVRERLTWTRHPMRMPSVAFERPSSSLWEDDGLAQPW